MTLFGISGQYLAIAAGAVAAFVIGMLWYAVLFGKTWAQGQGFSEQKLKELQASAPVAGAVSFVGYLVTGYILCLLFQRLAVTELQGALQLTFLLWLGFPAMIGLMNSLYTGKPLVVYLIDVGYQLVYLLTMAALLIWLS